MKEDIAVAVILVPKADAEESIMGTEITTILLTPNMEETTLPLHLDTVFMEAVVDKDDTTIGFKTNKL